MIVVYCCVGEDHSLCVLIVRCYFEGEDRSQYEWIERYLFVEGERILQIGLYCFEGVG